MTHQEFKERRQEILRQFEQNIIHDLMDMEENESLKPTDFVPEATQQLTQLFQDFKDAVIGEKDNELAVPHRAVGEFGENKIMGMPDHSAILRNQLRQTQHQTANLILKGE